MVNSKSRKCSVGFLVFSERVGALRRISARVVNHNFGLQFEQMLSSIFCQCSYMILIESVTVFFYLVLMRCSPSLTLLVFLFFIFVGQQVYS